MDDPKRSSLRASGVVLLSATLLHAFERRFVNRAWPYAVQRSDGSYRWRYERCDLEVLAKHLLGELTLALSSTDSKGRTKWLCLDVDGAGQGIQEYLVTLQAALLERGWPTLLEASRRGGHVWFLLDRAIPAREARDLVVSVLEDLRAAGIVVPSYELYPDTTAPSTLGHAVRLPLGVHRLSNQRYSFLDTLGEPVSFVTLADAVRWLVGQPRLHGTTVRTQWKLLAEIAESVEPTLAGDTASAGHHVPARTGTYSPVIRWVDAHVSPLDLLEEFASDCEMKRMGQGYLGWCPFHDDRAPDEVGNPGSPSFYIVRDRRHGWSWKCFSTNCVYSWGLMRHSFELFQCLLDTQVKHAILLACERWPDADAYHAITGDPDEQEDSVEGGPTR